MSRIKKYLKYKLTPKLQVVTQGESGDKDLIGGEI